MILHGLTKIKLCTTGGWWFSTTLDGAFEPQENKVARREIAAHPPVILNERPKPGVKNLNQPHQRLSLLLIKAGRRRKLTTETRRRGEQLDRSDAGSPAFCLEEITVGCPSAMLISA